MSQNVTPVSGPRRLKQQSNPFAEKALASQEKAMEKVRELNESIRDQMIFEYTERAQNGTFTVDQAVEMLVEFVDRINNLYEQESKLEANILAKDRLTSIARDPNARTSHVLQAVSLLTKLGGTMKRAPFIAKQVNTQNNNYYEGYVQQLSDESRKAITGKVDEPSGN